MDSTVGSGRALLVGTFPGSSYYLNHLSASRDFFAGLLSWADLRQQVQSSDAAIQARLHKGAGGTYLWIVNPTRTARTVTVTLPSAYQKATELWQSSTATVLGNRLTASVEERNAAVIRLD